MASVLVIDDHEATLETYSTILRLSGFETEAAASGKAGIDLARTRRFDVALVDRLLSDIDGTHVARELKLGQPSMRVVIVTAFPTIESSRRNRRC